MRKPIFLLLFMVICHLNSFGQGEGNNWFFTYNLGITFNTNPPSIIPNALSWGETLMSGCISDSEGNSLFHNSNGLIFDKNMDLMPSNGVVKFAVGQSHAGNSYMVHKINKDIYYLFQVGALHKEDTIKLLYHIIDMRLNGGLGDIASANNLVYANVGDSKLVMIPNSSGTGKWLVIRDSTNKNFLSFLVEGANISNTPVVTSINDTTGLIGKMKVSPDQTKIAVCNTNVNLKLYDFDNLTGKLYNPTVITTDKLLLEDNYDCEFSPNGKYLYVVRSLRYIDQYDITLPTSSQMEASRIELIEADSFYDKNNSRKVGRFTNLQIGPDGKIYIIAGTDRAFMSVVHNPNEKGSLCNLEYKSIMFPQGTLAGFGLPSIPGYLVKYLNFRYHDVCVNDSAKFVIDNNYHYDSLFWDFGEPSAGIANYSRGDSVIHKYNSAGEYKIVLRAYKFEFIDTLVWYINIHNYPQVSLGGDTSLCEGDTINFELVSFDTNQFHFLWSDSSTHNYIQVDTTMPLSVKVDIEGCAGYDTVMITRVSYHVFDRLKDTFSCEGDSLGINIGSGAETYTWSNGGIDSIGVFTKTGKYYVQAANGQCITEDSIQVDFQPKPIFNLGLDTLICDTDSITIGGTSGVKHLWNVGDTTQNITIKPAGTYILAQNTQYCEWKDTIEINVQQQPSLFIGNDTVVCLGEKVIMGDVIPNGIQYTWNNRGDATPKITTDSQSTYSVIAYDGVCRAYDTIFVGVYTPQSIELGQDSTLCAGTETLLDATINRGKYQWNDGAQTPTKLVKQAGNYSVQVIDSVCQYSDAITIDFTPVPPLELGPDTFLCQEEIYELTVDNTWEKITWSDGSDQYSRIFTTEGKYIVTADFLNCQATDSINIDYYPPLPVLTLGADQDVCDPLFYPLQANYNGYYGAIWQDGTQGTTYEVTETGDYIVSTQPHRCGQVSDTVHVTFLRELCALHIPNAFTPNGDGKNDTFFPIGYLAEIENIKIYNRWGELLFDGVTPWDGTYGGEPVPAGNYLYVITYKKEHRGGKKRIFTKGSVQVLR